MTQQFFPAHLTKQNRGFTILELMVAIVIFTLGFLGAYLLVDSANNISIRSRDEIIGSNLMREQVELLKNLRDTNWITFRKWNSIETAKDPSTSDTTFGSGYYTIENDFQVGKSIKIKKLGGFSENKDTILSAFNASDSPIRVCIDPLGRYTHSCQNTDQKTSFASFFEVTPLTTKDTTGSTIAVDNAYQITPFFVSTDKGYHLYRMDTIITDWKR